MIHRVPFAHCTPALGLLAWVFAVAGPPAAASTPASGRVYLAASFGTHYVWRADYAWDGTTLSTTTPLVITTLPTAADLQLLPDGGLAVAGQGLFCGGCIYRVDPVSGSYTTRNAQNNNNTLSLDPTGTILYAGWMDTNIATLSVSGGGLSDGTTHAVTGGEGVASSIAFTPRDGAFYVTGGTGLGNFGRLNVETFVAERVLANVPGGVVVYDPFSDSLIISGGGRAYQMRPGAPATVLSERDDRQTDNYIELQPDGLGHLFGTVCCNDGGLVMIDYSASGLIGDATSRLAHAALPLTGLSGGLALVADTSLCHADFNRDGFLDFFDYDDYVNCFETGVCPPGTSGDFNGDGFADFFDYDDFVAAFEIGC